MTTNKLISTITFFFLFTMAIGQVIVVDPQFPTTDEVVKVTLNTEGTALENYGGDVYAHTGVTANGVRWSYVIENWGNNETQPKLTRLEANKYELVISPTIRDYYNVPEGEFLTELCFVFRSAEEPWLQTSPDIFYDIFDDALSVLIKNPPEPQVIVQIDETLKVNWIATMADSSFLYVDNQRVFADTGTVFEYDIPITEYGKKWVRAEAVADTEMAADSFYYYVRSAPIIEKVPAGIIDGVNYMNETTVVLSLYAPQKEYVFAIGDFNNWEIGDKGYMKVDTAADRFWLEITNLVPKQEYAYQYLVDGVIRISDPYTEKILDPWNDKYIPEETYPELKPYPEGKTDGLVAVLQTDQDEYDWQNTDFDPPAITDLVVYELLIRDFVGKQNFQTIIDTLPYLQRQGINAIEFMPINEFDGNLSWGYNPNHYLAVDKFYGTKDAFKALVDACHGYGMAVILDVVYNHATGISPYCKLYWDPVNNRPAANSPFYNVVPTHDFNVFNDMNHESPASKAYISRTIKFWLEEFRVDGYRFDLSKGFTQKNTLGNVYEWGKYDQSRINTLKRYADSAWTVNPEAYFILEHFAENSEEKELSNYGMMLWGNLNHNYNQATMGWINESDFSWISYKKRGWNDPHVVGYMESHDEERLMFKNITYGNNTQQYYNVRDTAIGFQRQALAANFFFTVPGPKMIWQFGERGYDYSINYDPDNPGNECRLCEKPPRWDYLEQWRRRTLIYTWTSLIDLTTKEDVFETDDFDLDVGKAMKKIRLTSSDMSVVILGNFDVVEGEIDPDFYSTGTWYDFWTGNSIEVTDVNEKIKLEQGEFRLYTDKKLQTPDFVGVDEAIAEGPVSDFIVHPNPASSNIYINMHLKNNSTVKVTLYDLQGRSVKEIYSGQLPGGLRTLEAAVTDFDQGLYFVVINAGGQKLVKKVMVR